MASSRCGGTRVRDRPRTSVPPSTAHASGRGRAVEVTVEGGTCMASVDALPAPGVAGGERRLRREVGFWGLTFFSLGSIIGSGWLLGALTAAKVAGPASLISWIMAGEFL